jgi:outer membrane cobalamin receptor
MRISFLRLLGLSGLLLIPEIQCIALIVNSADTIKIHTINEITVTESFRNTEMRSSAPLQILSARQIENLNALQVSDAVKYFSGVTVKDYGGIGGLKTVSVRSLGAGHTAVSYDGISLTDCQTGQIDIGRFSLDNVDMLSLNNGQSDNIFQPARLFASAAVLNIRTLSPRFSGHKVVNGKVSFKGGSFGLLNPSAWLQYKISEKHSATLSAEWLSANGEYPYKLSYGAAGDSVSREIRKNTDVRNLRLEGSWYANFTERENAYIKTYFYSSQRGLPGATILYNTANFSSQRLTDATFFVQGHYKNDLSQTISLQTNIKYNHGFLHYLDPVYLSSAGKQESFYQQNEYYGSIALLYKALGRLSFSLSTDGFVNALSARFETDSATHEFARPVRYNLVSALAAKYVSEHWLGTASLLSTVVTETVEKGVAADNHNRLSPYISLVYKPFDKVDFRVRSFYKNIFRLPTFNDLYYARVGNVGLRPETTDQLNLGVTYSASVGKLFPLISFTADAYRNYVKDKIIAIPTKNIFVWTMVNLGRVEVSGLDLNGEASMAVSSKLSVIVGGTYTYQRVLDITDPQGDTYRHQVPYTPRVSGSGRLAIESPWVNVAYSALWSGARYAIFQNFAENRLAGYSDHSVSVSREFKLDRKILSINLEALNLLNENYAIVKWFPMPGRSFRTTVAVRF